MKIILFANTDWYLYNFRIELADALRQAGNEVLLLSPDGDYRARLEAKGFRWRNFPVSRRGINPLAELRDIFRLIQIYRQEKPDVVHHFTIKCVLYGTTAARLIGIKRIINSIEGLGYIFIDNQGLKVRFLRWLASNWYRLVLNHTKVIFLNNDDQSFFLQEGLVRRDEAILVPGSGVDIDLFSPLSEEKKGVPLVVLASRMLYDKGVAEFVEAARQIKLKGIPARFALAGNIDLGNPAAIPIDQLEVWNVEGVIEWLGWQDNMVDVYRQASIVCLPSYYREGLPKMLIEAGSCGLPLVATDMPGCRDVVHEGENGFLVPPRDIKSLANALEKLLLDEPLRKEMGKRSREMVKQQFSIQTVVKNTLVLYKEEK